MDRSRVAEATCPLCRGKWVDTAALLNKHAGKIGCLSRLHCVHHAIAPAMTRYGLGQPGEAYVMLSNSLAHALMYLYYAWPQALGRAKPWVTVYQYAQHAGALTLIVYQYASDCTINYPWFNVLGYAYFFGEYLCLVCQLARRACPTEDAAAAVRIQGATSLLFATNALHLSVRGHCWYAASALVLCGTSMWVHLASGGRVALAADRVAIAWFVWHGYEAWRASRSFSIVATAAACATACALAYGHSRTLAADARARGRWHAAVHALACVGHHALALEQ